MKRIGIKSVTLMIGIIALTVVSPVRAESALVMLEKGIYAEQTKGDVDAAMKIYQKIIGDAKANRKFVAQAQYRLGVCYAKKKQTDKAVAAFKTLIATYGEQKALVALATERLKKLTPPAGAGGDHDVTHIPLKATVSALSKAIDRGDVLAAKAHVSRLIASTEELRMHLTDAKAREVADSDLSILKHLRDALAGKDLKRAQHLLAALNGANPALEQALTAAVTGKSGSTTLSYVDDTAESRLSLSGSGHAVAFGRAGKVTAVQIFASRYGMPQAPNEKFHVYLLDAKSKTIAKFTYPYSTIARGEMKWYTLKTPATAVGGKFFVAISFSPHRTKGVYLGLDDSVTKSHSYTGLPGRGFAPLRERQDWMIRVVQTASSTAKAPRTSLNDARKQLLKQTLAPLKALTVRVYKAVANGDALAAEKHMAMLIDSTEQLRDSLSNAKSRHVVDTGLTMLVPIRDALAKKDLKRAGELLNGLNKFGPILEMALTASVQAQGTGRAGVLSYVDDSAESKQSLGGSGHAIVFKGPGKVTAVQIFAGRYGMPKAPDENFHVYLLDANNKTIADFTYPYSTIVRGDMKWYTLPTRPTVVGKKFTVALSFNPHQTKGVYLGLDAGVKESHSFTGLPGGHFAPLRKRQDWMVRVLLTTSPVSGASGGGSTADAVKGTGDAATEVPS